MLQLEPESRPPFEVTAKFLEHIRQFTIVEGSPVKLTQDKCNGSLRLSANIEDWIIDSKKIMEPTKNLPSWGKFCVCENDTTVIAHGTFEEKSSKEKKNPCHSNKRHSFFSGIRYKYFTPSTVTEDLVKSTPRKLAWFFNRVLHVQKKHKFDGSKKRSKTLNSTDGSNRPTLRSYRLFGSSRDCNSTEVRPRKVVNEHFHEGEEGIRTRSLSCHDSVGLSYNSKVGFVETPKMSSEPSYGFASGVGSGTNAFTNQTNSPASSYITEARLATAVSPPSSDYVDFSNASGCDADNPFVMSWPQTSLQKATNFSKSGDMNGFHEEEMSIPRRYSASDINVNGEMKSSKSRTFSTRQYPKGTKNRKYRSFFNFFQKHGKEKQST